MKVRLQTQELICIAVSTVFIEHSTFSETVLG